MVQFVKILSAMIYVRIVMIGWIVTYLGIVNLKKVVSLAIVERRRLGPVSEHARLDLLR